MSIRPEVIANKLAAIRRGEYPGLSKELETTPALAEMLWFLQFVSLEPGGLQKFASELLKDFHEHLGTELMLKVGTPKNGRYSAQQAANIWSEIDRKGEIFRLGWASEVYTVEDFSEIERGESAFAKENSELLERLCPETAQAHCGKAAEAELASFLAQYCNNPAQSRLDTSTGHQSSAGILRAQCGASLPHHRNRNSC